MSSSKHIFLILFVTLSCITIVFAMVKGGDHNSESSFSRINGKEKSNNTMSRDSRKKSAIGFSAVGIIMIILTIILTGIFIYYFFLFYPILCRKERNYDVVEHSRDTTPTPNTGNPL